MKHLFPLAILFFSCLLLQSCKEDEGDIDLKLSADFAVSSAIISPGDSITFSDQSTGGPSEWTWSFEGGTPSTSSAQNPTVTYKTAGKFQVKLTVSNGSETSEIFKDTFVQVVESKLYIEPIFTKITRTDDIVYGIDASQHKINLYEAEEDKREKRPVLLLFGGGGFGGSNLELLDPIARRIASYGIVVATARYRSGPANPGLEAQTALIKGQQDVHAAIRFFKAESTKYRIDSNKVISGGNATGAIISLFQSYVDLKDLDANGVTFVNTLGGLEGQQGNAGHSSRVLATVSLAGGMYNTIEPIDKDDPPLFAVHGTADTEIPYDTFMRGSTVFYGSKPIVEMAISLGIKAELYTLNGGGHSAPRTSSDEFIDELMAFLRSVGI